MYVDLFTNQLTINTKFANIFGLESAVYFAELIEISAKAVKKKTFEESTGFFKLDRKYISKMTTIKPDRQCELDKIISPSGILEVSEENVDMIRIDLGRYISVVSENQLPDKLVIQPKLSTVDKKEAKTAAIKQMLKNSVAETDPDVKQAYCDWIDSAYGKVTTKAQVKVFVEDISNYSSDKKVRLELIRTAITRQYRDAVWCIQIYEKIHPTAKPSKQKVATALSDVKF